MTPERTFSTDRFPAQLGPSDRAKSSETPLSNLTTSKCPYRIGGGRPRMSEKNREDLVWSDDQTIVWFTDTVMILIVHRHECGFTLHHRQGSKAP
jgi:hypothetical protein